MAPVRILHNYGDHSIEWEIKRNRPIPGGRFWLLLLVSVLGLAATAIFITAQESLRLMSASWRTAFFLSLFAFVIAGLVLVGLIFSRVSARNTCGYSLLLYQSVRLDEEVHIISVILETAIVYEYLADINGEWTGPCIELSLHPRRTGAVWTFNPNEEEPTVWSEWQIREFNMSDDDLTITIADGVESRTLDPEETIAFLRDREAHPRIPERSQEETKPNLVSLSA